MPNKTPRVHSGVRPPLPSSADRVALKVHLTLGLEPERLAL